MTDIGRARHGAVWDFRSWPGADFRSWSSAVRYPELSGTPS